MTEIDLPYVKAYRDRNRVWRYYFRRKKRNYGALPGEPGSTEFMEAYAFFLASTRAYRQSARDIWARHHQLLFVGELHQSQAIIEAELSICA